MEPPCDSLKRDRTLARRDAVRIAEDLARDASRYVVKMNVLDFSGLELRQVFRLADAREEMKGVKADSCVGLPGGAEQGKQG